MAKFLLFLVWSYKSIITNSTFCGQEVESERIWVGVREDIHTNRTILDKVYLLLFAQLSELLQELRIGFANAGGVIHFIACNQQCHCHAVVMVGAMLAHSTQAVGFFQRQRLYASGV